MYLIVYVNRKKEIIYRIVKYMPYVNIGEHTSMDWYVVDIQRYYNGRFIPLLEYKKYIEEKIKKDEKKEKKNIKKRFKRYVINKVKFQAKKIIIYFDRHPY